MAIDFSQVKTITIPEGSVTKITDSTGNTLWQGAGWHTVWEGTWNSFNGNDFTASNIVQSDSIKLRITMTYNPYNSTISQNYLQYNPSSTKASGQTSAKIYTNTYNYFNYTNTYDIAGISASDELKLKIAYKGNKKFGKSLNIGVKAYQITITKIEQYY